ncbi:hypothetical protein PPERSA_09997 [Pseudocohnilembus persalinus]|uniref:Uncharacterized protein n=1 Tax=Pseudocohnilembus persalinus TaxID=266149 RepID=A0A0V0QJX4_PSEPJ|nr:hypothetical protein PPERSA_09997 [Pseudocohnilembus persalinus]|eukprot:KRX02380.1 hypothetical protein PPERSA_09997 [Pseudocohnilembus persalinus]
MVEHVHNKFQYNCQKQEDKLKRSNIGNKQNQNKYNLSKEEKCIEVAEDEDYEEEYPGTVVIHDDQQENQEKELKKIQQFYYNQENSSEYNQKPENQQFSKKQY